MVSYKIKLGEELSPYPYGINERYGVRDIGDEKHGILVSQHGDSRGFWGSKFEMKV